MKNIEYLITGPIIRPISIGQRQMHILAWRNNIISERLILRKLIAPTDSLGPISPQLGPISPRHMFTIEI